MQSRPSKVQAETVIGRYIDGSISKAKKIDKKLIKRRQRLNEKRESRLEINEFAS